jgi:hypothetical protein
MLYTVNLEITTQKQNERMRSKEKRRRETSKMNEEK